MTALPEWVKKIDEDCCVQQCETPLIQALAIAWEALNKVHRDTNQHDMVCGDAMRRIEKLGEE